MADLDAEFDAIPDLDAEFDALPDTPAPPPAAPAPTPVTPAAPRAGAAAPEVKKDGWGDFLTRASEQSAAAIRGAAEGVGVGGIGRRINAAIGALGDDTYDQALAKEEAKTAYLRQNYPATTGAASAVGSAAPLMALGPAAAGIKGAAMLAGKGAAISGAQALGRGGDAADVGGAMLTGAAFPVLAAKAPLAATAAGFGMGARDIATAPDEASRYEAGTGMLMDVLSRGATRPGARAKAAEHEGKAKIAAADERRMVAAGAGKEAQKQAKQDARVARLGDEERFLRDMQDYKAASAQHAKLVEDARRLGKEGEEVRRSELALMDRAAALAKAHADEGARLEKVIRDGEAGQENMDARVKGAFAKQHQDAQAWIAGALEIERITGKPLPEESRARIKSLSDFIQSKRVANMDAPEGAPYKTPVQKLELQMNDPKAARDEWIRENAGGADIDAAEAALAQRKAQGTPDFTAQAKESLAAEAKAKADRAAAVPPGFMEYVAKQNAKLSPEGKVVPKGGIPAAPVKPDKSELRLKQIDAEAAALNAPQSRRVAAADIDRKVTDARSRALQNVRDTIDRGQHAGKSVSEVRDAEHSRSVREAVSQGARGGLAGALAGTAGGALFGGGAGALPGGLIGLGVGALNAFRRKPSDPSQMPTLKDFVATKTGNAAKGDESSYVSPSEARVIYEALADADRPKVALDPDTARRVIGATGAQMSDDAVADALRDPRFVEYVRKVAQRLAQQGAGRLTPGVSP